ncbi:MAG: hypothetical protein ABJN21_16830 [Paracoccaceae bacterium]
MDVNERSQALAEKMAQQLRLRSGDLKDVATRAGRKLPKHLRTDVDIMLEAQQMNEHPKLMHHVDAAKVIKSEKKLNRFLDKQDPRAERRTEILDTIAKIAFVIFSVVLAVFLTLLWRGHFN